MQGIRIELGPGQVDLVLKSIEIVKRTLTEFEDDTDRNIDTTEELSRVADILARARKRYDETAPDVQLVLY
jgi:hypothetical protein